MIQDQIEKQKSTPLDLIMFDHLKSDLSNYAILTKFRQLGEVDQIIEKRLIKIIKLSASIKGIEKIAGRAITILKKLTKNISWEDFSNIRLKDCSMRGMSFIECNFSESILENVIIDSCWFIECCLYKVKCNQSGGSFIHGIANSSDGTMFISSVEKEKNFTIQVFDFSSGKVLKSLQIQSNISVQVTFLTKQIIVYPISGSKQLIIQNILNAKLRTMKFTHHLDRLFYCSNRIIIINCEVSKRIFIHQSFNSKIVRKIHHKATQFAISNSGQYFAYYHNNSIEVCNLIRVRTHVLKIFTIQKPDQLFFTPNNQEIAVKSNNFIYFWNVKSFKLNKQIKLIHSKEVDFLAQNNSTHCKECQVIVTYNKPNFNFYDIQDKQNFRRISVSQEVQSILFHPKKSIMAIACQKNCILYIDYMAKQKALMKKSQESSFCQFALSQNAEFVASFSKNKLQIIKIKNGEEIKCSEIKDITSIAFSPQNNKLILEKKDSSLSFYDIQKQEQQMKIQLNEKYGWIRNITFSTNGTLLALIFSLIHQILIYDGITFAQLFILKGHSHSIRLIQFSPNEKLLASESEGKIIRLWNLKQLGQCIVIEFTTWKNIAFTFSPDNKYFVYAISREKIIFLDIKQNKEYKVMDCSKDLQQIRFFNDGLFLLCCSFQKLEILENQTGNIISSYNSFNYTNFFDFLFDGKILAQGSSDGIKLWDVYYEKSYLVQGRFHNAPVTQLAYSHSTQLLISRAEDEIKGIHDCPKQKKLATINILKVKTITLFHISKSGFLLGLVRDNFQIYLWNLQTRKLSNKLVGHKKNIQAIDFQDDDKQLLSCEEQMIYLWDIESTKILKTFKMDFSQINWVFFSLDYEMIYVVCFKQTIEAINLWKQKNQLFLYQHSDIITVLKVSLNRKFIVFGNTEGKIYVFDLSSQKIISELFEHDDQIIDINFSPDGNVFASVSKDETICFWKIKFDIIFEKVKYIKGVSSISFIQEGTLACGCNDGSIKTIQFLRQNIRPLNLYSRNPKNLKGQDSNLKNAEITSTQGFNIVEVLKNSS